ncbi:hypothetical protein [Amphritea sp.]|uniref:hypothetical protein n=1 Tax=Amphritea sp. TaxID=1872502 RepID=UPI0025BCD2DB|nr:hypothetical protein [Amphritea sp.]
MLVSTEEAYKKLAKHFYETRLIDKPITKKNIVDALTSCAGEYVPAYWRRLRNAIELDQRLRGFAETADKVKVTLNPTTSDPAKKALIKPKRRKVKAVSESDEAKLVKRLMGGSSGDRYVYATIMIVKYLGCRPAEIRDLEFLPGNKVLINSAKKRSDRGIDRTLIVSDSKTFQGLQKYHASLTNAPYANPITYVQKRLAKVVKEIWPQRKSLPTLYSWRHQMGCDLKKSDKSRIEIAAIMGHLSVESINQYGRPKHARISRGYLSASKHSMKLVKVTKPTMPPSQKAKFKGPALQK